MAVEIYKVIFFSQMEFDNLRFRQTWQQMIKVALFLLLLLFWFFFKFVISKGFQWQ